MMDGDCSIKLINIIDKTAPVNEVSKLKHQFEAWMSMKIMQKIKINILEGYFL